MEPAEIFSKEWISFFGTNYKSSSQIFVFNKKPNKDSYIFVFIANYNDIEWTKRFFFI